MKKLATLPILISLIAFSGLHHYTTCSSCCCETYTNCPTACDSASCCTDCCCSTDCCTSCTTECSDDYCTCCPPVYNVVFKIGCKLSQDKNIKTIFNNYKKSSFINPTTNVLYKEKWIELNKKLITACESSEKLNHTERLLLIIIVTRAINIAKTDTPVDVSNFPCNDNCGDGNDYDEDELYYGFWEVLTDGIEQGMGKTQRNN